MEVVGGSIPLATTNSHIVTRLSRRFVRESQLQLFQALDLVAQLRAACSNSRLRARLYISASSFLI